IYGSMALMEKTTLYLSGELQRSLIATAKREGRSQAEIIRSALAAYLSDRAPLPLRSIGAGSDYEVTGATSATWLRRTWQRKRPKKGRSPTKQLTILPQLSTSITALTQTIR